MKRMTVGLAAGWLAVVLAVILTGCSKQDQESAQRANDKARAEAQKLGAEAKEDAQKLKSEINKGMNGPTGTGDAERKLREAGHKVDQAAMVAQVKARLVSDVGLSSVSSVSVDVAGGVVTLSGTVATSAQKESAETAARQLDGVTSVVNNIAVQP